jgi:hypothetical protein
VKLTTAPNRALAFCAAASSARSRLVKEIGTRQLELDEITGQILSAEPDSISAELGRSRQFVTRQLGDIRQILNVDVQQAEAELSVHVSEIRMVPQV